MQCAAERKYCAGVLGQLRSRAAAQLRGNIGLEVCSVLLLCLCILYGYVTIFPTIEFLSNQKRVAWRLWFRPTILVSSALAAVQIHELNM